MERVSLFLGGARSGKSRLALAFAQSLPGPHVFVATAQAFDEEMSVRIDKHRLERDDRWSTVEAPLELASAVEEAGSSLSHALRVHYILPDRHEFEPCWPILREAFGANPPVATMFEAGLIDPKYRIEIELTVALPG